MAGNTTASTQENQTFTTSPVSLAVGVLNPPNSAQSVWNCGVGMQYASMTTVIAGSPASMTVLLEGTVDGTNWSTVATTTNVAGETIFATGSVMFTNLRARCTAVAGGTAPTINVYATASQTAPAVGSGGSTPTLTVAQGAANTGITLGWPVAQGTINPITSLTNATTTVSGTAADMQSSRMGASFQLVANAGVTGGAVTVFGSLDGLTFSPLVGAALIGSQNSTISNGIVTFTGVGTTIVSLGTSHSAIRYFRADVTTNMVGGSVTAKIQGF